jgi:hypothetical protein
VEQPNPSRHRRRERRRDRGTQPPPVDAAPVDAAPVEDAAPAVHAVETPAEVAEGTGPARRKPRTRRTDAERSLRGIVGAGSSQVGVTGAMRARDAARPTAEELAAAERDLVIVRRHYVPPDALPGAR